MSIKAIERHSRDTGEDTSSRGEARRCVSGSKERLTLDKTGVLLDKENLPSEYDKIANRFPGNYGLEEILPVS